MKHRVGTKGRTSERRREVFWSRLCGLWTQNTFQTRTNFHIRHNFQARTGDTLVEVVLAIAIFSMVGVAAVAVISASTSGSQEALELTITREAVDEQAELLRYIHSSVLVGMRSDETGTNKYRDLWSKMTENAVTSSNYENESVKNFINNYGNTTSCSSLYNGQLESVGAFILNPRQIYLGDYRGDYDGGNDWEWKTEMADQVVVQYDNTRFKAAATSPRLIYGNPGSVPDSGGESIYEMNGTGNEIAVAEGLFVFAVKDQNTTALIQTTNNTTGIKEEGAFYDFYIRSCWFEAGAERPSTVSTLVRLVDPTKVGVASTERSQSVTFSAGEGYYLGSDGITRQTNITRRYTWQPDENGFATTSRYVSAPLINEIPRRDPDSDHGVDMVAEGKVYKFVGYVLGTEGVDYVLDDGATEIPGAPFAIRYSATSATPTQYEACVSNTVCENKKLYPVWQITDLTRAPSEER